MATAAFAREEAAPRPRIPPEAMADMSAMFARNSTPMTAVRPEPDPVAAAAAQPMPARVGPEEQGGLRGPRPRGIRPSRAEQAEENKRKAVEEAWQKDPRRKKAANETKGGGGTGGRQEVTGERTGERGHGGTPAPHNA